MANQENLFVPIVIITVLLIAGNFITTIMIAEAKMELAHNWSQSHHELRGKHGTEPWQHYQCRACKTVSSHPENEQPPPLGCNGHLSVKTEKWRSPIKERSNEVSKKDYPASKSKKQRKG